jgi:CobQ-like glutamine amidotransferase family enzyme
MATPTLSIAHLYPGVMNIYGDRGNIIALRHRLEARGIGADIVDVDAGDPVDLATVDILHVGGGQDREQRRIAADLLGRGDDIRAAVDDGLPVLAVCGGFQLFGHRYIDHQGSVIEGIGIFDMETRHPGLDAERCIGDVVLRTPLGEVVGFENHGGRTFLASGVEPFGTVLYGYGNNGEDTSEGAVHRNAFGTYLHGSLLPKNPAIADRLIALAIERRTGEPANLEPLDDRRELAAHRTAAETARRRSRRPDRSPA